MRNVYFAPLTPKKQSWYLRWWPRRFRRGGIKKKYAALPGGEWKHAFDYRKSTVQKRRIKKTVITISILCAVVVLWFFLLVWLPYFRITLYAINGLQQIPTREVTASVEELLDKNIFFVFPGENYFLFSHKRLERHLLMRFPLESVTLAKRFPNYIEITVVEKGRSFIIADDKEYYYLDAQGKLLEKARAVRIEETRTLVEAGVTSTIPFPFKDEPLTRYGDIPLVRDVQRVLLKNDIIDPVAAEALRRAHKEIALSMEGWSVHHTVVDEQKPEFVTTFVMKEGSVMRIQYSLQTPPDELWLYFSKLWPQARESARLYVDMRFLPRAFYK